MTALSGDGARPVPDLSRKLDPKATDANRSYTAMIRELAKQETYNQNTIKKPRKKSRLYFLPADIRDIIER
jgi:hypothetical protein